jgi:hypothetical protein
LLCGRSASEYRAYLPRARWIRDANDSYFAAMTYPQGLPTAMQPSDIHDATWGVLSAVYGGAVHPSAEGHAAMADAALPAVAAVLQLDAAVPDVRAEPAPPLAARRISGDLGLERQRTQHQIERSDVRDHQERHIDDRDPVQGAELTCDGGNIEPDGVVVIREEVDDAHDIERDDKCPEQRTCPHREKRQHGQESRREVAIGGDDGEILRQIADDSRKDEDEPEEAKAVQRGDGALRLNAVHRPEPRPYVGAKTQQPGGIAEDEMDAEQRFLRHVILQ